MDFCALRSLMKDLQKAEEDFSKTMGLTMSQASMVCAMSHGYCELKQLQEKLGLTPSRVTRLVDSLVEKGLVERKKADGDRRLAIIALTDQGKRMTQQADGCMIVLPKDIEELLKKRAKETTWEKRM